MGFNFQLDSNPKNDCPHFLKLVLPLDAPSCVVTTPFPSQGVFLKTKRNDTLLLGPATLWRSALLFQACVTMCEKMNDDALYVTQKPLVDMPPAFHGMPKASRQNMAHLQFVYVDHTPEFLRFLASFHQLHQPLPGIIALDGLDHYIEQIEDDSHYEQRLLKLLALLQDVVNYCTFKRKKSCRSVVTCGKTETYTKSFAVFKRFFHATWRLRQMQSNELVIDKLVDFSTTVESATFHEQDGEVILNDVYLKSTKAETRNPSLEESTSRDS